jgi:pimeloyl-ACP methyl ester carboxylesterase
MNNETDPQLSASAASCPVHVVLVPGYWLGAWAWEAVEPALRAAGLTPHPVTLPGLDAGSTTGATLDDHIDAVIELVGTLDGDVVLVGHSGGGAVVQGVIDREPDRIRRVVYVDTGPLRDGASLRPGAMADIELPPWEELAAQGSSIDGMSDTDLDRFRKRAVPHPVGVASARVRLRDSRRLDVPASVICTSLPSSVLTEMIEAGHMPSEILEVHSVRYIDLPTGHWPMFSRPTDLAETICSEIANTGPDN